MAVAGREALQYRGKELSPSKTVWRKYYVTWNNYTHTARPDACGRYADLVAQPILGVCPERHTRDDIGDRGHFVIIR